MLHDSAANQNVNRARTRLANIRNGFSIARKMFLFIRQQVAAKEDQKKILEIHEHLKEL